MKPRWNEMTAIFLAACGTLLFEITCTKIFEFSLWANYAYLVISTAMFGLGLSGVILTRWPGLLKTRDTVFLSVNTLLCGVLMFAGFLALNFVPVHLPDAPNGWPRELLNVAIVFMALGLPFVCFGLVISFIFDQRGDKANVYYFADLIGAGLGSFILVPLIGKLEPQGLVVLSCLLAVLAAPLFLLSGKRRAAAWGAVLVVVVGVGVAATTWMPRVAKQIPLKVHVPKRRFAKDMDRGQILSTGWSALSRVDIAPNYAGDICGSLGEYLSGIERSADK